MKKIMLKSADFILYVIYQACKAFVLWYMYHNEMPGIPDVETWLCE